MTNNKRNDTRLSPSLNIFVACFTTCCARLHLYEALELLGKHCLYYDADSISFISRPGKTDPLLGDILSNSKISSTRETASSKLYRVVPGTTGTRHCVAKLVAKSDVSASSMNGSAQLNYQVMKQNVLDEVQKPPKSMHQIQVVNSFQILLSRVQNVSVGSHKKSIGSTDLY